MTDTNNDNPRRDLSHNPVLVVLAWSVVGGPLAWGVVQTLYKAALLLQ
jgi:hypothetical protein